MSSHRCTFTSPKDRAIFEITQELLKMALTDLAYLREQAQLLNRVRLEQSAALQARSPLTQEATHDD